MPMNSPYAPPRSSMPPKKRSGIRVRATRRLTSATHASALRHPAHVNWIFHQSKGLTLLMTSPHANGTESWTIVNFFEGSSSAPGSDAYFHFTSDLENKYE